LEIDGHDIESGWTKKAKLYLANQQANQHSCRAVGVLVRVLSRKPGTKSMVEQVWRAASAVWGKRRLGLSDPSQSKRRPGKIFSLHTQAALGLLVIFSWLDLHHLGEMLDGSLQARPALSRVSEAVAMGTY
jgi:hypothetical protein